MLCHTSRKISKIWPLNNPDGNFLDYYGCDVIEQAINKTRHNPKDELKTRIMATFTNLNKEIIEKACWKFQSCLKAVVKTNGNKFSISRYFHVFLVNI